MNTNKLRCVSTSSEEPAILETGYNDAQGRRIGTRVYLSVEIWEETAAETKVYGWAYATAPGVYYVMCPHATRNGQTYGAGQPFKAFTSADERTRAVTKYLAGFARRASKVKGAVPI